MFARERRDASTVRVPAVQPGTAVVVTRYDEEKAVVLSPEDFDRLAALDEALDAIVARDRLSLSPLAREAHRLEDEPGHPLEDPAALEALLRP
jgi:PHD/YefM family antitoxin component YafN of YafNO toxin-antitoxin module